MGIREELCGFYKKKKKKASLLAWTGFSKISREARGFLSFKGFC
jgi:hypothetical protein